MSNHLLELAQSNDYRFPQRRLGRRRARAGAAQQDGQSCVRSQRTSAALAAAGSNFLCPRPASRGPVVGVVGAEAEIKTQLKTQIKWLYFRERLSVRRIAAILGLSRWTVAHVINSECQPLHLARTHSIEVAP